MAIVRYPVEDTAAAVAFYTGRLGFRERRPALFGNPIELFQPK